MTDKHSAVDKKEGEKYRSAWKKIEHCVFYYYLSIYKIDTEWILNVYLVSNNDIILVGVNKWQPFLWNVLSFKFIATLCVYMLKMGRKADIKK